MRITILSTVLVLAGCAPVAPTPESASVPTLLPPTSTPAADSVLVGAGDIASCREAGASETAALIAELPGAYVFTAGDNAYDDGTAEQFMDCYNPTWGIFKDRTRPSPGNHDYDNDTEDASDYFDYFGAAAGEPGKGYYSYDIESWHIIALNSEIDVSEGSPQEQWLRQDLSNNTQQCTLAYYHRPLFSSCTDHGGDSELKPLFQALYDFHAEVVVNGHDHTYERFAKQDPNGSPISDGIREFVVGTGGNGLYEFGSPEPNSEVRYAETYGVIKFTLKPDSYDWQFIPVDGSFSDSGNEPCNPK